MQDCDIDLNIHNYEIEDIFKLFKIDFSYDINTLKRIKKQVIQLHHDKSNLDPKYFIFFVVLVSCSINLNL